MKSYYVVEITETLQKWVQVEAENETEAEEIVRKDYKDEKIILYPESSFFEWDTKITVHSGSKLPDIKLTPSQEENEDE